jgi:hypothetical protein
VNKQTDNEIKKLRDTQSTQETMIATLQAIVLQLQNATPPTPLSQQRLRKRQKPRNQNETSVKEDSDMDSDEAPHELRQMHAIASLQSNSIEQLSFIHTQMDESTFDDDLIPWDNDTTDNEELSVNFSAIGPQQQETDLDDLGETDPGEGTWSTTKIRIDMTDSRTVHSKQATKHNQPDSQPHTCTRNTTT